jgi:hypothetical protein
MAMFMTFGVPRGHGHGPSRPSTGLANTALGGKNLHVVRGIMFKLRNPPGGRRNFLMHGSMFNCPMIYIHPCLSTIPWGDGDQTCCPHIPSLL